ncbi:lactoylglutathione lyase [Chitinophaga sp. YR573]|uniref:VOC family protein n=1 Tax=Chitinophaga sp. YR573 TaxID=1881040 RepID=UPI0008C5EC78|nr:VOC family protein [Chitinophaga sp. YR573]SEW46507.1 lactoylglutathione lyase [Chitinophaga sp. YR573]
MKTLIPLLCVAMIGFAMPSSAQKKSPILNHIAVYVFNLEKSTTFYRDIVQIDTIPEPFHDGRHTWFKIGTHSQLHLIQGAKEITTHDKNSHLCFSVTSMDEFIARLNAHHIPFENWAGKAGIPTKRVDGVQQVYFTDPEGYWIEVNDDKY